MAKKRKAKKAKAKKKKKVKKVRRVKARPVARKVPRARVPVTPRFGAAYTLSLAGGIIILIAGILAILGIGYGVPAALTTVDMAVEIFCGLAILMATATIRRKPRLAGVLILIFSLVTLGMLAVGGLGGLIFGPILSLIGSIILLVRR